MINGQWLSCDHQPQLNDSHQIESTLAIWFAKKIPLKIYNIENVCFYLHRRWIEVIPPDCQSLQSHLFWNVVKIAPSNTLAFFGTFLGKILTNFISLSSSWKANNGQDLVNLVLIPWQNHHHHLDYKHFWKKTNSHFGS